MTRLLTRIRGSDPAKRPRGKPFKRILALVLVSSMMVGLLPEIIPKAQAAFTVSTVSCVALPDGRVQYTLEATPEVFNSPKGGVTLDGLVFFYTVDRVHMDISRDTTSQLLSGNGKGTTKWMITASPPEDGDWLCAPRIYDNSTGQSISTYAPWVRLNGLKYDRSGTAKPTLVYISSGPPPSGDRTKFELSVALWGSGSRRVTKIDWYLDNKLVNTTQWPNAHANHTNTYTGLTPGRSYSLKAVATSPIGETIVTKTEIAGAPGAPTNVQVSPGNNSYTYTWSPPTVNITGATIAGYRIYAMANETPIATITDGTTYTFSGTNGTFSRDSLRIAAYTTDGAEGAKASMPQTWVGSPKTPREPTIAKIGDIRQFNLAVSAPDNNGDAITSYKVYRNGALMDHVSGSTLNKTYDWGLLGMADNTAYTFTVSAVNSRGEGIQSSGKSFTTFGPATSPNLKIAEPTKLTGQAKLSWITPADNGGEILAIQILRDGAPYKTISANENAVEWQLNNTMYTPGQTASTIVTGLADGTNYSFTVRANNAYGNGMASNAKNLASYRIPDAPTGLSVTKGVRSLTLKWTAANNGGNAVSKYNVSEM